MVTTSPSTSGNPQDILDSYTDASGTPGNVTITTRRGKVAFANTASTVVVTNSQVTTSSIIFAVTTFVHGMLTMIIEVIPANGSFTLVADHPADATPSTAVFFILNY